MSSEAQTPEAIERRSLHVGKWGNLLMGVAGVVASFLSNSDALLVDGLYSGVNFVSAIIAAKIAAIVALRDAGANFAMNFSNVPEVKLWMEGRQTSLEETNGEAVGGPAQASIENPDREEEKP